MDLAPRSILRCFSCHRTADQNQALRADVAQIVVFVFRHRFNYRFTRQANEGRKISTCNVFHHATSLSTHQRSQTPTRPNETTRSFHAHPAIQQPTTGRPPARIPSPSPNPEKPRRIRVPHESIAPSRHHQHHLPRSPSRGRLV